MKKLPLLIVALLLTLVAVSCGGRDEPTIEIATARATETAAQPPPVYDFFPMKPGMEWVYQVELESNVKAVLYHEEHWPGERGIWARLARWRLISTESRNGSLQLIVRVKSSGTRESLPGLIRICEAPEDVAELEIVKDDASVFEGAKQVFWVICPISQEIPVSSVVEEVIIYDVQYFPAHESTKPTSDGHSRRPIFYSVRDPGLYFRFSMPESKERLEFMGPESANDLLYFRRVIEKGAIDGLDVEVAEDMIFAMGRGMTTLQQYVGEEKSICWTLVEFTGK